MGSDQVLGQRQNILEVARYDRLPTVSGDQRFGIFGVLDKALDARPLVRPVQLQLLSHRQLVRFDLCPRRMIRLHWTIGGSVRQWQQRRSSSVKKGSRCERQRGCRQKQVGAGYAEIERIHADLRKGKPRPLERETIHGSGTRGRSGLE